MNMKQTIKQEPGASSPYPLTSQLTPYSHTLPPLTSSGPTASCASPFSSPTGIRPPHPHVSEFASAIDEHAPTTRSGLAAHGGLSTPQASHIMALPHGRSGSASLIAPILSPLRSQPAGPGHPPINRTSPTTYGVSPVTPAPTSNSDSSATVASNMVPSKTSRPRRSAASEYPKKRVNVACEVCRGRKTRCDAVRPRCGFCVSVNAICVYRRDEDAVPSRELSHGSSGTDEIEMVTRLNMMDRKLEEQSRVMGQICILLSQLTGMPSNQIMGENTSSSSSAPISSPFSHDAGSYPPSSLATTDRLHYHQTKTLPSAQMLLANAYPSLPPQELAYGGVSDTKVKILGFHLNGLTCISKNPTPPPLKPMLVSEQNIEMELSQWANYENQFFQHTLPIDYNSPFSILEDQQALEPLIDAFVTDVLPWYPIMTPNFLLKLLQSVKQIIMMSNEGTPLTSPEALDCSFIMFAAALGRIAAGPLHFDDAPNRSRGYKFFHIGDALLFRPGYPTNNLRLAHCSILKSIYLQMSLRPLNAYQAISRAAHTMQILIRMPNSIHSTDEFRQINNAFWACYLIEHSLQIFVSWSSQTLQEYITAAPPRLPEDDDNALSSFWFNAAITLQRTFSSLRPQIAWTQAETLYQPVIALEISTQLEDWQQALPQPLRFKASDVLVSQRMHNVQGQYLRAHYYALKATVHWPMVVRMLTPGNYELTFQRKGDPNVYTVKELARQSLKYSLMHLRAVTPMMDKRYVMILTNITTVFCMTMFLLCTMNVPELADIYPLDAKNVIVLAWQALSAWKSNLSVEIRANMVEDLMRQKGIQIWEYSVDPMDTC